MTGEQISGRVRAGAGEAAAFTGLDWVRSQLVRQVGIDPAPGTLNLVVADAARERWLTWRERLPIRLDPPDPAWCPGLVLPVRIAGCVPGAVICPQVPDYPDERIEIVAPVHLRTALGLRDDDPVVIERLAPLPARTVLFDLDGTLVDSLRAYRRIAEAAAAPHGLAITDEHIHRALSGQHVNFWDLVVPADHPGREALFDVLHREAVRVTPAMIDTHARAFPEIGTTLTDLAGRGFMLGIVTGSGGHGMALLEAARLLGHFRTVVTAYDVERRKPDPQGLLLALERLGATARDSVYVGDSEVDVLAARAAGMQAVAVLSGGGDCLRLATLGADRVLTDHRALPAILAAI